MLYKYLRTAIKLGSQQTVNDDIIDTYRNNSFYQTDMNVYNDQSFYKHQYNLIRDTMIHDYSFQLNDRIVAASEAYRAPDIEIKEGEEFQIGEDKYLIEVEESDKIILNSSNFEQGTYYTDSTYGDSTINLRSKQNSLIYLPRVASRIIHYNPLYTTTDVFQDIICEIDINNRYVYNGGGWTNSIEKDYTLRNNTEYLLMLNRYQNSATILPQVIDKLTFSMENYNGYIIVINKNNEILKNFYLFASQVNFILGINTNYQLTLNIVSPESFFKTIILGNPITYTLDNIIYEVKDTNINSSSYPIYTDYSDS